MNQLEQVVAALLSLGAIGTGLLALCWPRRAGTAIGLPFTEESFAPYLRAIGARNFAVGLILASLTAREDRLGFGCACFALALTAVIDASLTFRRGGRSAFLAHVGGALFLLGFGARLLWR